MARVWGERSADLAPYVHDYALALKLAGRREESIAVAEQALGKWSEALQLQVLAATGRAEIAIARQFHDPRTNEALAAILKDENLARLRGIPCDPGALFTLWSEMLLHGGRLQEGLEVVDRCLAVDPRSPGCRENKARLLIELQRPAEAVPLLRALLAERPEPAWELFLGSALLECGDAAGAWQLFAPHLSGSSPAGARALGPALVPPLQMQAAKALLALKRPREAAELLVERLAPEPENGQALHRLAMAARLLGANAAAEALDRRMRDLARRESYLGSAVRAAGAGYVSSVPYFEAVAALVVCRAGQALELLAEAARLAPRIARLHSELARAYSLVGLEAAAERALRAGLESTEGSPLVRADLAALLARTGRGQEAVGLLELRTPAPATPAGDRPEDARRREEASRLAAHRALARLELGDAARAAEELAAGPDVDENAEEMVLARAEVAILGGRLAVAKGLLAANFDNLPGGPEWASALRALVALIEGEGEAARPVDPSDLLDLPRLLRLRGYYRGAVESSGGDASSSPAAAGVGDAAWERAAPLRALDDGRTRVIALLPGAGAATAERLRELLAIYVQGGAARKARELAFYLVHLQPREVEDRRRLARILERPEEVMPRLQALKAALHLAPGDADLGEQLAAARRFLGLGESRR
jgi:predicted Zn-dependent protease